MQDGKGDNGEKDTGLLTADQVREHVETGLSDDALQRLIDAAEADIVRHLGDHDASDGPGMAQRRQALVGLVNLAVRYDGLASESVGPYTAASRDYHAERAKVLTRLNVMRGREGIIA